MIYLTREMISKFSLREKKNLTDEELNDLIYFRIKLSTYNLLTRRDYFLKEIKQKLREKHNFPEIIDEVLEEFLEKDYINDEERARSYAKLHQNYGPKKLYMIFSQMGLEREIIEEVLKEDSSEQVNKIKEQWFRLGNKTIEKKIASLMRKGFLYRDIKETISSLKEEEEL
ncbi:MAG: recombinase RecX [Fusobacteriales bacterium]|nr:MAG: recombinase RecX [Fusobacteriales bacterium]